MKSLLSKAEYFLALSNNAVTDEIRENYFSNLGESPNYLIIFSEIAQTLIDKKREHKISKEEAISALKKEYREAHLANFLVNEEEIFPLIDLIFIERSKDEFISIESLKTYIDIADKINHHAIKLCVYNGVLNALLTSRLINKDIEFAEKLISFIKQGGDISAEDKQFLHIMVEAVIYVE